MQVGGNLSTLANSSRLSDLSKSAMSNKAAHTPSADAARAARAIADYMKSTGAQMTGKTMVDMARGLAHHYPQPVVEAAKTLVKHAGNLLRQVVQQSAREMLLRRMLGSRLNELAMRLGFHRQARRGAPSSRAGRDGSRSAADGQNEDEVLAALIDLLTPTEYGDDHHSRGPSQDEIESRENAQRAIIQHLHAIGHTGDYRISSAELEAGSRNTDYPQEARAAFEYLQYFNSRFHEFGG